MNEKRWLLLFFVLALVVAVLSPLASSHPDGLERVAEDQGFIERAQEPWYKVIPDYVFPGIPNEAVATILAGLVGTLLVFGLVWGVGKLVARRNPAQGRG
jgi:hypothetical protein